MRYTDQVKAKHGHVVIDGDGNTIEQARCLAARILVQCDVAEHQSAVKLGFRRVQHAYEMFAHDSDRDQRETH